MLFRSDFAEHSGAVIRDGYRDRGRYGNRHGAAGRAGRGGGLPCAAMAALDGGAGGGVLLGWANSGHSSAEFNGWYPGGNGVGGRAVLEFYNPNGVVLRYEFQALKQRIDAAGIA